MLEPTLLDSGDSPLTFPGYMFVFQILLGVIPEASLLILEGLLFFFQGSWGVRRTWIQAMGPGGRARTSQAKRSQARQDSQVKPSKQKIAFHPMGPGRV